MGLLSENERASEDEQLIDVTELQAAIAALNGCEPPSGRAVASASILSPITERRRREEEAAAAAIAAALAEKEANMKPGDEMEDGSIYAGLTEDGTQKIFAMPRDLGVTMTFNDAAGKAAALNAGKALDHDDWQVPDLECLRILQKNQNEGGLQGTFKTASGPHAGYPLWYWSSTENRDEPSKVGIVRFSDGGAEHSALKDDDWLSCRLVRLVPILPSPA